MLCNVDVKLEFTCPLLLTQRLNYFIIMLEKNKASPHNYTFQIPRLLI
jgi:hypothetical protein